MSAVQPECPLPACVKPEERIAFLAWVKSVIDNRVETRTQELKRQIVVDFMGAEMKPPEPAGFGVPIEIPERILPAQAKAG